MDVFWGINLKVKKKDREIWFFSLFEKVCRVILGFGGWERGGVSKGRSSSLGIG